MKIEEFREFLESEIEKEKKLSRNASKIKSIVCMAKHSMGMFKTKDILKKYNSLFKWKKPEGLKEIPYHCVMISYSDKEEPGFYDKDTGSVRIMAGLPPGFDYWINNKHCI